MRQIAERGINFQRLALQAGKPDADPFDVLCHPALKDHNLTADITIAGKVLPVSGIQQELFPARESGVKEVLIPEHKVSSTTVTSGPFRQTLETTSVGPLVAPSRGQFWRRGSPKLS
jgi:hypothetical protein